MSDDTVRKCIEATRRELGRVEPAESVDMNRAGLRLLGMAVTAIRQLEGANPFAGMALRDFRRALDLADLSEEYLDTLDPLALPLLESKPAQGAVSEPKA